MYNIYRHAWNSLRFLYILLKHSLRHADNTWKVNRKQLKMRNVLYVLLRLLSAQTSRYVDNAWKINRESEEIRGVLCVLSIYYLCTMYTI